MVCLSGLLCGPVALSATGDAPHDLWRSRAMFRAPAGKRGPVDERGHSALAPQFILDAAGAELLDVDVGAIPVDLLRSLLTSGHARAVRRRHHLLLAGHTADCGFGATAAP